MDKLIIDRQRWLRGEGSDDSSLLRREDGKMCCLGFDMLRRGYTPEQIAGVPSPSRFKAEGLTETAFNYGTENHPTYIVTEPCANLMALNDSRIPSDENDYYTDDITDLESEADREARIAAEFAKIGIEVEFVG